METDRETAYFEEISHYLKEISGFNLSISAKDREVLFEFFSKGYSPDQVKSLIKKEILKYPPEKRKKFRISYIEKYLKKHPKNKKTEITINDKYNKWKGVVSRLKIPESVLQVENTPEDLKDIAIQKNILNYIWKKLPEQEKEKIKKEAIQKLKKRFILTNIDQKTVLKSIIREILKEKYNIK
ncbi:hypothetical protein [Persephonella sp.]|uniref:hypothetical protein n=1 Tax=Persephonella sp. TaxID=2060922 RepID=UPI0025ED9492|nr:hypothetical protein [Persephonella sp.]